MVDIFGLFPLIIAKPFSGMYFQFGVGICFCKNQTFQTTFHIFFGNITLKLGFRYLGLYLRVFWC